MPKISCHSPSPMAPTMKTIKPIVTMRSAGPRTTGAALACLLAPAVPREPDERGDEAGVEDAVPGREERLRSVSFVRPPVEEEPADHPRTEERDSPFLTT